MDEFQDLDAEIAKLRDEMQSKEAASHQFQAGNESNYWRRRIEEERMIWKKKFETGEEVKKAMEMKLAQQKGILEQYNQNLKQLEKKFEHDTRNWQERLMAKEAELLLEKNRLLNEAKVKEAEFENHKLLSQIAELNIKINELKDNQIIEKQKLSERYSLEKGAYEEKIKACSKEVDLSASRVLDVENIIKEKTVEFENIQNQYKNKIEQLEKQSEQFLKEKKELNDSIGVIKNKAAEEKLKLENLLTNNNKDMLQILRKYVNQLSGLSHFAAKYNLSKKTWAIFKKIIQNIENEIENFAVQSKVAGAVKEPFKVVFCMSEEESGIWKETASSLSAEIFIEVKNIFKIIKEKKPQVLIISSQYIQILNKINSKWPFLPIILAGSIEQKKAKKVSSKIFALISSPYTNEEIRNTLVNAVRQSIAYEEYWDSIAPPKKIFLYKLSAVIILLSILSWYGNKYKIVPLFNQSLTFTVPYAKPTNIAFDGNSIWVCDWFGQSVYRHKPDKNFQLIRIFNFPEKHFTALTWAGGFLWSIDPWDKKIYRHNLDEKLTILSSYPIANSTPTGLAGDQGGLWSCDSSQAMIFRHKFDSQLTVEDVYESPGKNPSGLFFDGKILWSTDSKTNRIYCHKIDEFLSVIAVYIPPEYDQKNYNISGIACDKDNIWLCSEKSGKIFMYPKNMLKKVI